jgi:hypothetical protein
MVRSEISKETDLTSVAADPEGAAAGAMAGPPIRDPEHRSSTFPLAVITAVAAIAVVIAGYHPYAEDGGIYLPGIFKLLHPALYPHWSGFVTAQSRFSLFAPVVADLVRFSEISVMGCILLIYVAANWVTLYAGWRMIACCSRSREACIGAVWMLALCMTMPIAGTSLILMDPYVTARSISTPCGMLAVAGALEAITDWKKTRRLRFKSVVLCGIALLLAAVMHPLMASYAAGCVVLLACSAIERTRMRMIAFGSVAFLSILVAGLADLLSPEQPDGYVLIASTRYYWFLSQWQWYEIIGVIAPLMLLLVLWRHPGFSEGARWMAEMAISAGSIGLTVSLLFAREPARSSFVAMLQPLRVFLVVYVVMILLAGAYVAEAFLKRKLLRWAAVLLPLGALMFFVQMQTYPHSSHLEFPWVNPTNDWERGFGWIRNNTPTDAAFALDAKYILISGEDAQNFRAIAERSAVPDYQKDGGIASIDPDLTGEWLAGQTMQNDLADSTDAERLSRLAGAGVRWIVLPDGSVTGFSCPYRNNSMKVCRVPER